MYTFNKEEQNMFTEYTNQLTIVASKQWHGINELRKYGHQLTYLYEQMLDVLKYKDTTHYKVNCKHATELYDAACDKLQANN